MKPYPKLRPNGWDALVALAVAVLAVFCLSVTWLGSTDAGLQAVITVDGEEVERIALENLSAPVEKIVEANGCRLHLTLNAEGAVMAESSCPTQDCVRTGTIRRSGQSIVCLPARVIVTLEGGAASDGPDVVIG